MSTDFGLSKKLTEYSQTLDTLEKPETQSNPEVRMQAETVLAHLDKDLDLILNKIADRYDKNRGKK